MVAPTIKEPSDGDPGTAAKWGAPDAVHTVTIIKGTHATERIPIAAIEGTAVSLSATQTITAPKTFNSSVLKVRNAGDTFSYTLVGGAIAADRNMTLPALSANDIFVFENQTQTLVNKTINAASNTLTGVARTDAANTFGDFSSTFKDDKLMINNPADTFAYTIVASAIAANRNITLPLLTANDTFVTANFIQTITNKTIGDPTDSTKALAFTLSGATTAKTLTLISAHTDDRSITFPDATTTLVGHDTTQTLTNKTLTAPIISSISNSGTITLPTATTTLVGTDTTDTLSNKTLTAPKFADLGFIADANGNELIVFDTVTSAVNEITLANSATGNPVLLSASGGDTNVNVRFVPKGTGVFYGNMEVLAIAIGDETTALTTGTAKVTFRMPYAFKLVKAKASLTTVSSSGNPTFDVNEGGTSIFGINKLSIDANEKTSATATTPVDYSDNDLADDAEITIDIDTAGTGATGAKIYLIGYATAKPA